MTRYDDDDFSRRIPGKLIACSFVAAMVADFIPFSGSLYWLPEFTALVLMYWLINRPRHIGIGTAFGVGLLADIGRVAPLGGHSLAYSICAYLILTNHRQFGVQNYGFQAVVVLLALFCNEAVLTLIRWLAERRLPDWTVLLAPAIGALLWPLLNKIMLAAINAKRFR